MQQLHLTNVNTTMAIVEKYVSRYYYYECKCIFSKCYFLSITIKFPFHIGDMNTFFIYTFKFSFVMTKHLKKTDE